ncbi:MAG: molybdopterin oxidoreductase [Firmicutes bacterium]|nr:molybdopterin oxidoreductase [Bacillota bacterium]
MKIVGHGCTLDCFDCCKFNVYVDNGKVEKIVGDKNHPYTKGIICKKGRQHLDRLYHKKRIYNPLLKVNGKWEKISFDEAINILSEKLLQIKEKYSSNSVLTYEESGSNGVLKSINNIFFNFFGGVTKTKGSTCWGAGISAQIYDFGDVLGHSLDDLLNAEVVIMWGRNPYNTSIHLLHMLKEAKKRNVKIVVIDPLKTNTAKLSDKHISINPATDGALAMAITKIIIDKNLIDKDFINRYVKGFDEYKKYLDTLSLDFLSKETGVSIKDLYKLADIYIYNKSTIYMGYGLQKYKNGGNTIRAIDALAAIAGKIGTKGQGVNYADRVYPDILDLDPFESKKYAINERYFKLANLYDYIKREKDIPIKAVFFTKANPLAQLPNLNEGIKAINDIDFKVCIDMFMTDTAKHCDLFIPCTNTLESEDIVYSSMNNYYITYNERVIKPKHKFMDEYYLFRELARKMGYKNYPQVGKKEYLKRVVKPLKNYNINLDDIKNEYITIKSNKVAWSDLKFKTPSKKIEIYSNTLKDLNKSPIPIYKKQNNKRIRLITSHPRDSIFTQHMMDKKGLSIAYINKTMADRYDISDDDKVILKSSNGEIKVKIKITEKVPDNIVHMYTGWWNKNGNPNFLTNNIDSDIGGQIAYYDTFINIEKEC